MGRDAFRAAAEAGDMDALAAALHPEVHFRGPAFATPDVVGRDRVAGILRAAFAHVYRDFRFVDTLDGARHTVHLFTARVGEHELEGAQVLRFGEKELVVDLAVIVRPAPAAAAVGAAILERLDFDPREAG
jgi:hypothetical protein